MCGIVAHIGGRDCVPILLEGLARLEYRGYDSAGIAVLSRSGEIRVHKAKGRVADLAAGLPARFKGSPGIGHTRWATHGEPSDANAHPHVCGPIAIVHNGIIENADELRAKLSVDGAVFASETDSEVLAHLIAASGADNLEEAVRAGADLGGRHLRDRGSGRPPAGPSSWRPGTAAPWCSASATRRCSWPPTWPRSSATPARSCTSTTVRSRRCARTASRPPRWTRAPPSRNPPTIDTEAAAYDAEGYTHFMRKEIHEQPRAVERALRGRLDSRFHTAHLGGLNMDARELREIRRVLVLGCGSAYYSGQVGAQLIEDLARIPAVRRAGLGVPLPQPRGGGGHAVRRGQPVRRDVRHAGRHPGAAAQGRPRARGGELGRQRHRPASATAACTCTPARRSRSPRRRRSPPRRWPSRCWACTWAASTTSSPADGRRIIAGLHALPGQIEEILAGEQHVAERRRRAGECPGHVLHRPGPRLPGRPGGGAEAQGGLLPARGGLPGQRAQARAARAGEPGPAHGRDRP